MDHETKDVFVPPELMGDIAATQEMHNFVQESSLTILKLFLCRGGIVYNDQ